MRSTLDTAKDKLAEDQFKTLFDNPRIGSHNSNDVWIVLPLVNEIAHELVVILVAP